MDTDIWTLITNLHERHKTIKEELAKQTEALAFLKAEQKERRKEIKELNQKPLI